MFGRKKKKNDLDWQPDSKSETSASGHRVASPPALDPKHEKGQSMHLHDDHSDVWTGLIHPRSILAFFGKNIKSMALITVLVVVAGLALFFVLPEKYATKALILVDPRQPRITSSETVLSGIGGDAAALASYVEIMNSDGFLDKVVDQLGVADDPDFAKAKNKTELIGMFRENMSATRQGATYIVEVYYKSKVKEKAAKYANGMAEAFVRDQKDIRTSTSQEATSWLLERLTLLQTNLKKSENAVAAYQAKNGIVEAGAQGTLDNQQLTSLVGQLATAKTELAEARARYLQASKDGVPASANLNQSGQFANLDQLMQEKNRLRRAAAELSQTLGGRHPRMLANQEQQRIISGQISQERRRLVQRTKQSYQTAEAKKQSLERQLADARARSIELNKAMVQLATLEREASANRNLYEQFLARYKITDEQSQLQFSEARIVSKAPVPFKSTKPSIKLVLPVLIVLGFGLGALIALIKEAFAKPHVNHKARSPEDYLDKPAEHFLNEPSVRQSPPVQPAEPAQQNNVRSEKPKFRAAEGKADRPNISPPLTTQLRASMPELDEPQAPAPDQIPVMKTESTASGSTVVHLDRSKSNSPAAAKDINKDDAPNKPAKKTGGILIALPDMRSNEMEEGEMLDELLAEHHQKLEQFVGKNLDEDNVSLLVTAAQPGEGQDLTADLVREFAIDSGFHPVVISIQDRQHSAQQMSRAQSNGRTPERVARLQEFETYDLIPFACASGISDGNGLAQTLSQELSSLIALCKENYGFVVLETRQILDPDTLEDLIGLADSSLLVLEAAGLANSDLDDWQSWADASGVGLVLDQTQN